MGSLKPFVPMLLALTAACPTAPTPMILEKKDVQFLRVDPFERGDGSLELEISGLAFHSALVVIGSRIERVGDAIVLEVELGPARDGLSGTFERTVEVPADVNEVLFGSQRKRLWRR